MLVLALLTLGSREALSRPPDGFSAVLRVMQRQQAATKDGGQRRQLRKAMEQLEHIRRAARDGQGQPLEPTPRSLQERLSWRRIHQGIDALGQMLNVQVTRPAEPDAHYGKLTAAEYQHLSDVLRQVARRAERSGKAVVTGRGLHGREGIEASMGWRVAPYSLTLPGRGRPTRIEITTGNLSNHKDLRIIDTLRRRYVSAQLGERRSSLSEYAMWGGVPLLAERRDYQHLRSLHRQARPIAYASGRLVPDNSQGGSWRFEAQDGVGSGRVRVLYYTTEAHRAANKVRDAQKTIVTRSPVRRVQVGELVGVITREAAGVIKVLGPAATDVHKVGTAPLGKGYHLTLYRLGQGVRGSRLTFNVTDRFAEGSGEKARVASRQWQVRVD